MSGTGIDYSKYPFKIIELRQMDWDGLLFTIDLNTVLKDDEKVFLKKLVNDWYDKIDPQNETGTAPHFLSDFTWAGECNLSFWVDFGRSDEKVLEDLLDQISKFGDNIKRLYLGRAPVLNLSKEQLLRPLEEMGLDPLKIPFKVFCKSSVITPPVTINFKRKLTNDEKVKITEIIYNYFTKDKLEKDEVKYFLGLKWTNDQVGWWTPREFLLMPATLYPFFELFTPYKEIVRELIIGCYFNYDNIKKFIED